MWALLLWGIWTISRFCWCCCWNWLNYCSSPIVEGPTKSGLLQMLQECSHCEIVADLWSAPSFVFLKKCQGSSRESPLEFLFPCGGYCESLLEILSPCEDTFPPLSYLDCQSDEKRIWLRDRDRPGSDLQWVPGFLSCCSWMFPERLGNKFELVGSEGIRQVLTEYPRYETLSYWILLRVFFSYPRFDLFRNPGVVFLSHCWRDWIFLVFSGVSLETAAIFLLFLKVAMVLKEKFCQQ